MAIPRDLTPGSHDWVYNALGWEERLERRPTDYGEPHRTNPSDWDTFTDWERSPEHLQAVIF